MVMQEQVARVSLGEIQRPIAVELEEIVAELRRIIVGDFPIAGTGLGSFAAVFLEDADQHPRIGDRIELTSELIAEHATTVIRATTRGQGAVERVMSLVLLGDLVSLYLAVLRGIDPTPVRVIDDLKARLAKR